VTASQVNKGEAVDRILNGNQYKLIVCTGDDAPEENMFRLDLKDLITIRVGDGETRAQYRLPPPAAFRQFLADAISA
jgi:trehalose-6-phosphatase